ncbi:MAG TPA: O-antigen ligase family protein [Allosphingosinicella sp.]|jgi:hypothetical protein
MSQLNLRNVVGPVLLALCILFGGASAEGDGPALILQLGAIMILFWALLVRPQMMQPSARRLQWFMLAMLAVLLLQLVPLPPGVWQALPGRERIAQGYQVLGLPLPWLPLSLAPYETALRLLWILPPLSLCVAIVRLGAYRSSVIAWVIVGMAALSTLVGALQVAGGVDSGWYLYRVTNRGTAVGLFANRNHLATLLLCAIPFLAALAVRSRSSARSYKKSAGTMVLLGTLALLMLFGLAINTSLAGLGLAVPVTGASLLLLWTRQRRVPIWAPIVGGVLTALAVAAVFLAPLGNNLTSAGVADDSQSRYNAIGITIQAGNDYFPIGSGAGTFVNIYRLYEEPERVEPIYMNHAHSDFAEIYLETGVLGLLVLIAFLIWWGGRTLQVWRADGRSDPFTRAATIATGAIIAHSLVDYPLRTTAIAAIFAVALALMTEARSTAAATSRSKRGEDVRHLTA